MTDTETQLIINEDFLLKKPQNISAPDFNEAVFDLDQQNSTLLGEYDHYTSNELQQQSQITGDVQTISTTTHEDQTVIQDENQQIVKKDEVIGDIIHNILTEKKIRKKRISKQKDDAQQTQVAVRRQVTKINGCSFRAQAKNDNMKNKHWTEKEEEKFYRFMGVYGMDWNIIAFKMETKNRKQVMAKYNRDDKVNPQKIDLALKNQLYMDNSLQMIEQQ